MKVVKAELTAKILITAMIVILVGVLIVWMTGVFSDKKADINSGTGKIESKTNEISEFDILAWDGETIGGKALVDLSYELASTIKKNSLPIEINVISLNGDRRMIVSPFLIPMRKQFWFMFHEINLDYIIPTGIYKGNVDIAKDNRSTILTFTQQK